MQNIIDKYSLFKIVTIILEKILVVDHLPIIEDIQKRLKYELLEVCFAKRDEKLVLSALRKEVIVKEMLKVLAVKEY